MTNPYFEIYRDNSDEYRWRLKSTNGKIIADSGEGYKNKSDCEYGIDLVSGTNEDTDVIDAT